MTAAATSVTHPSRVVSFDLDDTLIRGPFSRVITDVAAAVAETPEEAAAIRSRIRDRHRILLDDAILDAYDWHQIVRDSIGDRDPGFDMLDRLDQYARDNATKVLHADTPALLGQLREAGWQVAMLTNGWRRYQEPILRHAGLLPAFDELVTSDDVGVAKPDPQIFQRVRGQAETHVHVGDRLDHDIVGGNASGARTVLLRVDAPDDPDELDAYLQQQSVKFDVAGADQELTRPDLVTNRLAEVVRWVTALPA